MRVLRKSYSGNLEIIQEDKMMDRRNFLKSLVWIAAGWTIFKWLKPLENISGQSEKPLREADFYRSGDHLAG